MLEEYPRNLTELEGNFAIEEACRAYLKRLRWPGFLLSLRIGKSMAGAETVGVCQVWVPDFGHRWKEFPVLVVNVSSETRTLGQKHPRSVTFVTVHDRGGNSERLFDSGALARRRDVPQAAPGAE